MERWSGRVAVVTGASAGIGAAIAEELVKKGLRVVGLARRVERVEDLATSLKSQTGKLYPIKCDVSKEAEVKSAFNWVKENLGGIDILINNAAIGPHSNLIDGPEETWRSVLELNVLALSVCTKLALRSMKERGVDDGHIIHINSIAGHEVIHGFAMYGASKHAVTALTETLRKELEERQSKIKVTSVSPGLVKTDMIPKNYLDAYPSLEAKDVADAVLYVLGTSPHVQIQELTLRAI